MLATLRRASKFEVGCFLFLFLLCAYLSLYNIGNAPYWHDEANLAIGARNLANGLGYSGWDGRILYVSSNGIGVNDNLNMVYFPPWQVIPSALGVLVFGDNETGVRFFHAVLGLLSVIIFWALLRLDFAGRLRLRLLAVALFALSAQTLLFFRQGRYCADAMFFSLALFYCYRLYISPNGDWRHLLAAAVFFLLGFMNHFGIAASMAAAILVWHLLFHARVTTVRQWREVCVVGGVCAAICIGYLHFVVDVTSERDYDFSIKAQHQLPYYERIAWLFYFHLRDTVKFGTLPWVVAVWLLAYVAAWWNAKLVGGRMPASKKQKNNKRRGSKNNRYVDFVLGNEQLIRWLVIILLFLFFSSVLTPRGVDNHKIADSRYLVASFPFLALIKAYFVDWVWRQRTWGRVVAPVLLMMLLSSNMLARPFLVQFFSNIETGNKYLTLPALVMEMHRPYENVVSEMVDYLNTETKQDETISVSPWQDHAILQNYFGDKLIFCCSLDGNSPLPKDKVRALSVPLYIGDVKPDWMVAFCDNLQVDENEYELVFSSQTSCYPAQRPEIEMHVFQPRPFGAEATPSTSPARVYRRRL